tara:strand:- start:845 stop:1297 length:453 start_codon:yes stop_codon:yes gene_type:complete
MRMKKLILILIFFALTNCGYKPMFSKSNNLDFGIRNIEMSGDKNVNRKIISLLDLQKGNKEKKYDLNLISQKTIETAAKDKAGNTSIYRTKINVTFNLLESEILFKSKDFEGSFSYNTMKNKFDLLQYQRTIEINLIESIAEEIKIFLNS